MITKSSNVGVTLISADLGAETVFKIMSAAGLGQATGLGFPGESVGILPYPEQMDDLRLATVSYGYGMAVSPLQLAQSYTSFTQHGCRLNATLLLDSESRPDCQRVMSDKVARQVKMRLITQSLPVSHRSPILIWCWWWRLMNHKGVSITGAKSLRRCFRALWSRHCVYVRLHRTIRQRLP